MFQVPQSDDSLLQGRHGLLADVWSHQPAELPQCQKLDEYVFISVHADPSELWHGLRHSAATCPSVHEQLKDVSCQCLLFYFNSNVEVCCPRSKVITFEISTSKFRFETAYVENTQVPILAPLWCHKGQWQFFMYILRMYAGLLKTFS